MANDTIHHPSRKEPFLDRTYRHRSPSMNVTLQYPLLRIDVAKGIWPLRTTPYINNEEFRKQLMCNHTYHQPHVSILDTGKWTIKAEEACFPQKQRDGEVFDCKQLKRLQRSYWKRSIAVENESYTIALCGTKLKEVTGWEAGRSDGEQIVYFAKNMNEDVSRRYNLSNMEFDNDYKRFANDAGTIKFSCGAKEEWTTTAFTNGYMNLELSAKEYCVTPLKDQAIRPEVFWTLLVAALIVSIYTWLWKSALVSKQRYSPPPEATVGFLSQHPEGEDNDPKALEHK